VPASSSLKGDKVAAPSLEDGKVSASLLEDCKVLVGGHCVQASSLLLKVKGRHIRANR
jgi:hypothetical protein